MNKGDIFLGRFINNEGNFEYRIGRSNIIDLTIAEYGINRCWTEAQQAIVYGCSEVFESAEIAMRKALNLYDELKHLNHPVETIFYDSVFSNLTKQEALDFIYKESMAKNAENNGVKNDSQ